MNDNLRNSLPVAALRGIVAMPYTVLSFDIGKAYNAEATDEAINSADPCLCEGSEEPRYQRGRPL